MKKFVKSFTINEKKWGRATEGTRCSGLLRNGNNGKQCCLGIYLTACGFKNDDLNGQTFSPKSVVSDSTFWNDCWPNKVPYSGSYAGARKLAEINDTAMRLSHRRKAIIKGFKKLGVTVKFK